jgi:hypothetical protein
VTLREQAEADQEILLENENDFGVPVKITDNDYNVYNVIGIYHRIGVEIDPETGLLVPGSQSRITVRLSSLGGIIPFEDWKIEVKDITGTTVTGYIASVMLDRTLGRVTMILSQDDPGNVTIPDTESRCNLIRIGISRIGVLAV